MTSEQVHCPLCQSGPLSAVTNLHAADFMIRFGCRDEKGRDKTVDYYPMRARACLACGALFPILGEKNLARLRAAYDQLTPCEVSER